MEEKDILQLAISNAVEASKKYGEKKDIDQVGLHSLYNDTVDMAEAISYHAVKGVFPEELFKYRSPNQTEAEAKYIKENYKQHTLPVYVDYRSTITRPFADGNWNINYLEDSEENKKSDNGFKKYVEYELPIYGRLENFIKFILPDIKSIDANGFISVRPKDIPLKQVNDEFVVDADKLYEPTVFYHKSESVINYNHNFFYLFLTSEKSLVKVGEQKKKEGLVFELYTKNAVYYIIQIGDKSKHKFDIQEGYPHGRKGYVVDHVCALEQGGLDNVNNMQYQTIEEGHKKDKIELTPLGKSLYCNSLNSLSIRTVFNCKGK